MCALKLYAAKFTSVVVLYVFSKQASDAAKFQQKSALVCLLLFQ